MGDPMIRWTVANFSVVSLEGITHVSTEELYAMAAADAHPVGTL
ncbi:hypothetical protein [Streptomyces sp. NBC_00268]|nr:hypothetical protein [Streptomyces sp. NBC_00268]MCX5182631.1 hypothetical protein [Streptomyces sp. NBC_00268]